MNFSRLLKLNGVNFWTLVSAIALNVIWVLGLVTFVSRLFANPVQSSTATIQLILIAAAFIGPFLIAWFVSAITRDLKGPTYGLYGGLTSALLLLFLAFSTGLLVLMLIVAAISGGLNGGLMSLRGR